VEETPKEDDYRDRLLRLQAEYDNYRKSMEKRFRDQVSLANERLIIKMLRTVDDFGRMIENTKDEEVRKGMEMIYVNMMDALKSEGVERIECAGRPFDPFEQEAVEVSDEGECDDGTVIKELRAGYRLNGKVIRTALVRVKGGKK